MEDELKLNPEHEVSKMATKFFYRLPIRSPYVYLEVPRRNFFVGLGWKLNSQTRPVSRGVIQRTETTEHFRELELRLSLIVSLVFVCAVPPRHKPAGDPSHDDWPNIHSIKPIFIRYNYGDRKPKRIPILSRVVESGFVRFT